MPGLDGLEVLRRLYREWGGSDLLSGNIVKEFPNGKIDPFMFAIYQ